MIKHLNAYQAPIGSLGHFGIVFEATLDDGRIVRSPAVWSATDFWQQQNATQMSNLFITYVLNAIQSLMETITDGTKVASEQ